MMCDPQAIDYDAQGVGNSVIDDKTDSLVPYGSIEKLADRIVTVLRDYASRRKL